MKKQNLIFLSVALFCAIGMFACTKSKTVPTPKETVLYQTNFSSNDGH